MNNSSSLLNKQITLPKMPRGIRLALWIYTIVMIIGVFVCVDHWFDMSLAVWHSNDFLDCLFSGKITKFYEYCYQSVLNNGYFQGGTEQDLASYSPIIYLCLAILISPLYLADKIMGLAPSITAMENWCRIIMIGFCFLAAYLVKKILDKILRVNKTENVILYFMTSPIFFLSVIIINQLDIIGVIFCLLAFDAYIEGKMYKFSTFIAVAVGFKYFPLIMFFPLLLLKEKKILNIIKYTLISVLPYSLIILFVTIVDPGYGKSIAYQEDSLGFFGGLIKSQFAAGISGVSIVIFSYCIICAFCYVINTDGKLDQRKLLAYWGSRIAFISYVLFFTFINAHEQWYIYLLPFMTFIIFTSEKTEEYLVIDTAFGASFLITSAVNRDLFQYLRYTIMVQNGNGNKMELYQNVNFYNQFINDVSLPFSIMTGFAMALVLAIIIEGVKHRKNIDEVLNRKTNMNYILLTVRLSTVLLYVIPLVYMYWKLPVN